MGGAINGPTSGSEEYTGFLKLDDGIVSFDGYAVQLKNVSYLSNYPVKPFYRIGFREFAVAGLLLLAAVFFPLAIVVSLIIIGYGIWERTKPVKYALSMHLNSGYTHYFIDKDRRYIDKLYDYFVEAIAKNKNFHTSFINKQIVNNIENSIVDNSIHDNRMHHINDSSIIRNEGSGSIEGSGIVNGNGKIGNQEVGIGNGAVVGDVLKGDD